MVYFSFLYKKVTLVVLSFLMVFALVPTNYSVVSAQTEGTAQGVSAAAQCLGLKQLVSLKNRATSVTKVRSAVSGDTDAEVQTTINCVLDSAAIILRETLIRKITSSIVTWINTGFEGSPSFVTNIDDFLLDTADEAFGTFIYNESNFAHLCSPFQFDIRFALALSYSSNPGRPACTLSDIVDNVETAIDDLSVEWDWDVYETITTDPSGNVFSSYIQSQGIASDFINSEIAKQEQDIARGSGFLSYENCEADSDGNAYSPESDNSFLGPLTESQLAERNRRNNGDCQIVTPGSVIGETLTNSLNLDVERIGLADEFNEIVGALVGQLAQQAFGREGVSGLTERSGSSNSFIDDFNSDIQGANNALNNDLAQETERDTSIYTNVIAEQNQVIQVLLQSKIRVSEALACFDSKYNTWIDQSGNVISPEDVEDVPEALRSRAIFVNGFGRNFLTGDGIEFLTPQESLSKVNEYQSIITRIDGDLLSAESDIEQARTALEITARYRSRLETSRSPEETRLLFDEYTQGLNTLNIDTSGSSSLQSVQFYTEQALNGTITFNSDGEQQRQGGAIQDLARCQTFNQVFSN